MKVSEFDSLYNVSYKFHTRKGSNNFWSFASSTELGLAFRNGKT